MQTNSELWLDRTLRIGACGTWWVAGTPGGQALGTLQLDPELVAQPETRQRVAAAVAAVRAANPPGVLRTTELVCEPGPASPAKEVRRAWLVVATVPQPTLEDLLAAHATLPDGAASGIAADVAASLRQLHAAGLAHGALTAGTVVLTGAGAATLTEVGVLAAVRDAPTDLARDAVAWAVLVRDLAAHAGEAEASLLLDAAGTAESGDLTAAARRLELRCAGLPDFQSREALAGLLPALEPVPAGAVPEPSTVDYGPLVRLRFGPGVPDAALLHPRPLPAAVTGRGVRRWRRVLAWAGLALLATSGAAMVAWWLLLR